VSIATGKQSRKSRKPAFGFAGGGSIEPLSQSTSRNEKVNWDRIEGNWKQFKGNVKEQWGKLSADQLDVIAGKRDNLAGNIQEMYGISKEEADRQLTDWQKRMKELNRVG
jgi:uncharacterized protein YjbJ (UPF0337 family)